MPLEHENTRTREDLAYGERAGDRSIAEQAISARNRRACLGLFGRPGTVHPGRIPVADGPEDLVVGSLPLRVAGSLIGTLTIYSGQPNAFDAQEVDLLTEFVDDLSYGIGALRARAGIDLAQSVRPAAG